MRRCLKEAGEFLTEYSLVIMLPSLSIIVTASTRLLSSGLARWAQTTICLRTTTCAMGANLHKAWLHTYRPIVGLHASLHRVYPSAGQLWLSIYRFLIFAYWFPHYIKLCPQYSDYSRRIRLKYFGWLGAFLGSLSVVYPCNNLLQQW